MAAQLGPHTPDQIRGLLKAASLHKCPTCLEDAAKVIESRQIESGRRRRFMCQKCEHRFTRVELTSEAYSELKAIKCKYNQIVSLIGDLKLSTEPMDSFVEDGTSLCYSCKHYSSKSTEGCSFSLPEAGTEEAKDCNLFEAIK